MTDNDKARGIIAQITLTKKYLKRDFFNAVYKFITTDPIFIERQEMHSVFGTFERSKADIDLTFEVDMSQVAFAISEIKFNKRSLILTANIDILNTPMGRILADFPEDSLKLETMQIGQIEPIEVESIRFVIYMEEV